MWSSFIYICLNVFRFWTQSPCSYRLAHVTCAYSERTIGVPVTKLFPSTPSSSLLVLFLRGPADVLFNTVYNSSSHLLAASSPGPCLLLSKDSVLQEFELVFSDIFFRNQVPSQLFSDILIIGQFFAKLFSALAFQCTPFLP